VLALKAYWKSAWQLELATLAWACSLSCAAPPSGPGPQAAAIAASRVHHQASPRRPELTLVERDGDPRRGLAVAVHLPGPARIAAGLSLLVESRIHNARFETARSHMSPVGFVVYALVDTPEQAARFISVANRALTEPVSMLEATRVSEQLRAAPPRAAATPSESALARCSGELVLERPLDAGSPLAAELVAWQKTLGSRDVAFAVVGSREYLDAASTALTELPLWARATRARGGDIGADQMGRGPGVAGRQALSVALWGVPAASAIAAAERFGEADSMLSLRLGAGVPLWRVARVASNLTSGAACLRVDLEARGEPPAFSALASSAREALAEIEHTLSRVKPGPWVVAKQVLATDEPDRAAAVAAWQAVQSEAPAPIGYRRLIHYAGELTEPVREEQLAGIVIPREEAAGERIEVRRGVEPGQGKYWLLLASPCGTSDEDASTAGSLALALHSSAVAHGNRSGVHIEPWLNVDSMGLVAHAPALTPHESPTAQAERVAETLARALLSAGPSADHWVQSREALLDSLGQGPTPALSLALRQTSADHPSWLDARGTWAILSSLSARSVELRRQNFLRGRLRLASLANHDELQSEAGERRLLSLLRGAEAGLGDCPVRRSPPAVAGQYRVETGAGPDPDAIISVQVPSTSYGLSEEVLWTETLMNRTDGWLQRALVRPGLVSAARARALGGATVAALVVEVHVADGKREDAVAQVRGLFERLRAGAATEGDVRVARQYSDQSEVARLIDPRGRLVDLWRGRSRAPATLASLRAFHRAAFEAGREVVVLRESGD
jgi:hypothetical protein